MANHDLIIEFWDVGQGDASVLRIGRNQIILIDVGPRNSPIVDFLLLNPSIYIESIILTHNDADHAAAMAAVVDAAKFRIGTVFFLQDRNKKEKPFAGLFSRLREGRDRNEIKEIRRLEAPSVIWADPSRNCHLDVKYPFVADNILASEPNITSGIIALTIERKVRVVWAGDARIESVERECGDSNPDYMVGPHHGAPLDRADKRAAYWLESIGAETNLISVGSNNPHAHPQPRYIGESLLAGSKIVCTQLTKLCDKSRKMDVVKSHGRLGLPHPNTGIGCRGPVRLIFREGNLISDGIDAEHQAEITNLQRPKCLRLRPAWMN